MKIMKRLMAWVLAIAMMAGMFSIETKKTEAAMARDTYELVTPTKDASGNWVLPEDGEYVIVYEYGNRTKSYYAINRKSTSGGDPYTGILGTVNGNKFQPSDNVEEDNILWKYDSTKGFTLSARPDINLTTDQSVRYPFLIKNNDGDGYYQLAAKLYNYSSGYLGYFHYNSGQDWRWNTDYSTDGDDYDKFKFYKKVTPLTLTVEWYLDGTLVAGPTALPASAGRPIIISKPGVVAGADVLFERGAYEDDTAIKNEPTSLTIQKDRTVRLYYKSKYAADDLLYPDDVFPEDGMPVYPDPGAVAIKKSASSDDFKGTGVAKVELSTVGVPIRKGVDIVLLLDNSTSMKENSRLTNLKKVATDFTEKVLGDNEDGSKSSNRLAIVTFAGFSNKTTNDGLDAWNDRNNYTDGYYSNNVLYPLKNAESKDAIINTINSWTNNTLNAGTDYDYPFQKAQEILKTADPNREKFVIFMTDGAPSKYNGAMMSRTADYDNYGNLIYIHLRSRSLTRMGM